MKYEDIKFFSERCEEHPDHQSGMISNSMIQQRLHEEIDELRAYIESQLAQPEQEPVAYDKTEINCFVQDLYDKKMQEGKHGHYDNHESHVEK